MTMTSYTLTLERKDFQTLLLALGYAAGAAFTHEGDEKLSHEFLVLAHHIAKVELLLEQIHS